MRWRLTRILARGRLSWRWRTTRCPHTYLSLALVAEDYLSSVTGTNQRLGASLVHCNTCYTYKQHKHPPRNVTGAIWNGIWGLWRQKLVFQAGISNCIPQYHVGCNYLSLPEIPASGTKVLICLRHLWIHWTHYPFMCCNKELRRWYAISVRPN